MKRRSYGLHRRNPTGIIPESLMQPQMAAQVVDYLLGLAIPGAEKAALFGGWAHLVGAKVLHKDVARLRAAEPTDYRQIEVPSVG